MNKQLNAVGSSWEEFLWGEGKNHKKNTSIWNRVVSAVLEVQTLCGGSPEELPGGNDHLGSNNITQPVSWACHEFPSWFFKEFFCQKFPATHHIPGRLVLILKSRPSMTSPVHLSPLYSPGTALNSIARSSTALTPGFKRVLISTDLTLPSLSKPWS